MEKYKNKELSPKERAADLLSRMTNEEKAAQMDMIRGVEFATKVHSAHFCAIDPESDYHWDMVENTIGKNGIGFVHDTYSAPRVLNMMQRYMVEKTRLGIPCIFTGEALHGISLPGAMVFPMPIAQGASFDPDLTREIGHAIATEARSLGICEILAPNLDLAREPRWGRTEETFGEDTYLSSRMAYAIITGEQGNDLSAPDTVAAEPKHYCVHGIPEGGLNCSPARVGKREVETAYLPVFEAGIKKAGAYNAMASYNCIDGEAVISSEHYLREILKERYGMRGYQVTSGEGMDRCDLKLYGRQNELIERVGKTGTPVVLVLQCGKPVDISKERNFAKGIIVSWFGGEFGAKAIRDVLFGEICPGGKLPVSFPKSVGHLPCYYSMLPGGSPAYLEGDRGALYPFGFGLSYTTFEYSDLRIEKNGRYDYTVSVDVTNTGDADGDEIVQLYVEDICSSVVMPPMLLQGFKRLPLKAGERKTAVMQLDFDSFKLLNKRFEWVVEPGEFSIKIGAASNDIRLEKTIEIK